MAVEGSKTSYGSCLTTNVPGRHDDTGPHTQLSARCRGGAAGATSHQPGGWWLPISAVPDLLGHGRERHPAWRWPVRLSVGYQRLPEGQPEPQFFTSLATEFEVAAAADFAGPDYRETGHPGICGPLPGSAAPCSDGSMRPRAPGHWWPTRGHLLTARSVPF